MGVLLCISRGVCAAAPICGGLMVDAGRVQDLPLVGASCFGAAALVALALRRETKGRSMQSLDDGA